MINDVKREIRTQLKITSHYILITMARDTFIYFRYDFFFLFFSRRESERESYKKDRQVLVVVYVKSLFLVFITYKKRSVRLMSLIKFVFLHFHVPKANRVNKNAHADVIILFLSFVCRGW